MRWTSSPTVSRGVVSGKRRNSGTWGTSAPTSASTVARSQSAQAVRAGSERAAVMALGAQAGSLALFFAGTRPERTSALVLVDATARYLAADDYPIGVDRATGEEIVRRAGRFWGTEDLAAANAPEHAGDERFLHWSARLQRGMASPSQAERQVELAGAPQQDGGERIHGRAHLGQGAGAWAGPGGGDASGVLNRE